MWTWLYWRQLAERCVKTAAQTAAALLTVDGLGVLTVDWVQIGSVVGLAAAVSMLTSLGSTGFGPDGTPSVVPVQDNPSPEAVRLLSEPTTGTQ